MTDLCRSIDDFFSQQAGVLEWGVASAEPLEHPETFQNWLAAGKHGEMTYLENHLEMRLKPAAFFSEVESIVLFLQRYPQPILAPNCKVEASVAAYACGPDYHYVIKTLLRELEQVLCRQDPDLRLKAFVDSAPVMERALAVRAGLGWIGRNGMLLHPQHGSQFFIGGFFLNRQLDTRQPVQAEACGTCRRCIEACPTAAIGESRQINASRCISYLTIEKKDDIDRELLGKMGSRIFGCDTCQQVCPWNKKHLADAPPSGSKFNRTLDDWLQILTPGGGFKRLFKVTPLYRAGRQKMLRNVEIAISNKAAD